MKKYIVVTNVFGKKRDIFGNLVEFLDEEKEYFDNKYIGIIDKTFSNQSINFHQNKIKGKNSFRPIYRLIQGGELK